MKRIHLQICLRISLRTSVSLAPSLPSGWGAQSRLLSAPGTQCALGAEGKVEAFLSHGWVTGQREEKGAPQLLQPSRGPGFPVDIIKRDFPSPCFPLLPRTTKHKIWSAHTPFASSLPTRFLIPYNVASTALFTETVLLDIRNFLITKARSPAQPSSSGLS